MKESCGIRSEGQPVFRPTARRPLWEQIHFLKPSQCPLSRHPSSPIAFFLWIPDVISLSSSFEMIVVFNRGFVHKQGKAFVFWRRSELRNPNVVRSRHHSLLRTVRKDERLLRHPKRLQNFGISPVRKHLSFMNSWRTPFVARNVLRCWRKSSLRHS